MRLLTKEWYHTMTDSRLGVCLVADERTAEFSEEAYQTLRTEKLERWLRDRKKVCEVLEEPFNPEGERRSFDEFCERELEHYRARMPERILSKVADLRVLALGYCTEEVFRELEDFRRQCEKRTIETMEAARKEQEAAGLDKIWTGEHALHDSVIESFRQEGEDLVVEFERDEVEWPEIKAIRFHDARILKQERPIENAWWLYDEIWKTDDGYEVHALLWRDGDVFELTILCRETELVWTITPKSV